MPDLTDLSDRLDWWERRQLLMLKPPELAVKFEELAGALKHIAELLEQTANEVEAMRNKTL